MAGAGKWNGGGNDATGLAQPAARVGESREGGVHGDNGVDIDIRLGRDAGVSYGVGVDEVTERGHMGRGGRDCNPEARDHRRDAIHVKLAEVAAKRASGSHAFHLDGVIQIHRRIQGDVLDLPVRVNNGISCQ